MRPSVFVAPLLTSTLALALVACGVAEPQPATPPRLKAAAVPAPYVEPGPKDAVSRASVDATLKGGLGKFLGYVDIEAAVEKGKFVGWRVLELRGPQGTWDGVDLKVGDIVTSLNGFPIEREYQADKAFHSLSVASEIRVGLIRGGKKSELRLAIVEEGEAAPASAPAASAAASNP
jgi:S1-C subfamily serine protease